jgi:VWFA-related protein
MLARLTAFALSIVLLPPPGSLAAPQAPTAADANPANQQSQTIRSSTRLVQLSVIAQDGKGEPIPGLKKDDFIVLDEGKPQNIAFFSCGAPPLTSPPPALPANYFTNRFDLKGEDPGAVTVILFDSLNTSSQDQSFVRKQILRFLQTVKPQDHVALYALSTNLIVLHDFTRDVSALVAAVNRATPKELAAFDASNPEVIDFQAVTGDPQWQSFQNRLNNAQGQIADRKMLNRIGMTAAALEMIAAHVANISGRKSLIWVSGGFPIQIGMPKLGNPQIQIQPASSSGSGADPGTAAGQGQSQAGGGDPTNQLTRIERENSTQTDTIRKAADALNRVDMAIYPVDARGVMLNSGMAPTDRTASLQPSLSTGGFFERQDIHDTATLLADRTGGKAFYGTNDISDAIRRAFDDGRCACNLGFYPDHGKWDGEFRELKVKVKADGAHLRYRQGYYASAEGSNADDAVKSSLQQAAMSPLETTSLGMVVSGKAVAPPAARNLQLQIALDPRQFLLKESAGRQNGALDMAFVQRDVAGNILAGDKQHLEINFEQKQYEFLCKAGMILQRHVTVLPDSEEIRVVVRDLRSGFVGSVTVPVESFFPAPAGLAHAVSNQN